jgi:hypothetical protein
MSGCQISGSAPGLEGPAMGNRADRGSPPGADLQHIAANPRLHSGAFVGNNMAAYESIGRDEALQGSTVSQRTLA